MLRVIIFFVAILATPATVGCSLLVFMFVNNWLSKQEAIAIARIITAEIRSLGYIETLDLHVSRFGAKKFFAIFGDTYLNHFDSDTQERKFKGDISMPSLGNLYCEFAYEQFKFTKCTITAGLF